MKYFEKLFVLIKYLKKIRYDAIRDCRICVKLMDFVSGIMKGGSEWNKKKTGATLLWSVFFETVKDNLL